MTFTPRPRRLSLAALALVLIVGCTTVAPAPTAVPQPTASPSPISTPGSTDGAGSPTPQPSATDSSSPGPSGTPGPTGSEGPAPSIDPALAAQIDAAIASVPEIRELEPTRDVPYQFISREQFQADLQELAFADVPEDFRLAEERLLKRLGLVPDDANLTELLLELYGGQVAAYYQPDNGTFYIIQRDEPFGPLDKMFTVHEYTHALQDQHYQLEANRIKDLDRGDAILGQLAAIEGDATLTMQQWADPSRGNLTFEELIEVLTASLSGLDDDTLAQMPLVLRRQLEFPYTEGFLFIDDVHGLGGFEAVNETLIDPPDSTEQILHSQKYYDGEAPVDVELDDLSATLGDGWSRIYEQTMGELLIQVLATGGEVPPATLPGLPVEWPHAEAAAGWGGDRLNMYEHTDGRWGIVWESTWDSGPDAAEFVTRIGELASSFDGVTELSTEIRDSTTGGYQQLTIASDQGVLDAFEAALLTL
jgi:hypothetical protein